MIPESTGEAPVLFCAPTGAVSLGSTIHVLVPPCPGAPHIQPRIYTPIMTAAPQTHSPHSTVASPWRYQISPRATV